MRQQLIAFIGDEHDILDAHSAEISNVDSRLDRQDRIGRKWVVVPTVKKRTIVNAHSDAMTEPVHKLFAIPRRAMITSRAAASTTPAPVRRLEIEASAASCADWTIV